MGTVSIINYDVPVKQDITADLFLDFVSWIDRSEKTTRTYLTNLKQFFVWLKYAEINRPEKQHIILFRQWLISEHEAITLDNSNINGWSFRKNRTGEIIKITCKPNTAKQYLQSVRQFFSWTAENDIYPNITIGVHLPKVRTDIHKKDSLTAPEVLQIENSIKQNTERNINAAIDEVKDTAGKTQRRTEQGKRLLAIYLLAVNAGLRTVEISRANIKDLEIKGDKAYLYIHGKGHNEADQKKPLVPEVAKAIDDYIKCRSDYHNSNSPLFVATGNRSKGRRIAPTTISTMLKSAMKTAGFDSERLTAHSLRHTTGQNVMRITGDNIYKTQMYMRHNSPKTTEIYLNNDSTAQDEQISTLLYDEYHRADNKTAENNMQALKVSAMLQSMTPAQLQQMELMANAILK